MCGEVGRATQVGSAGRGMGWPPHRTHHAYTTGCPGCHGLETILSREHSSGRLDAAAVRPPTTHHYPQRQEDCLEWSSTHSSPTVDQSLGHCFGCGKLNPIGLQLKPFYDGEKVSAVFTPGDNHQGWHHVTRRASCTACSDEMTAYAVLCSGFRFGVTARSAIRFKKPAATGIPLMAVAWATRVTSRLIEVQGHLATHDGDVVAEVESSFIPGPRYDLAFLWDMDG